MTMLDFRGEGMQDMLLVLPGAEVETLIGEIAKDEHPTDFIEPVIGSTMLAGAEVERVESPEPEEAHRDLIVRTNTLYAADAGAFYPNFTAH